MKFTSRCLAAAVTALLATGAQAVTLIGLTSSNELARIDTGNVAAATRVAISGLDAGDRFVGIDLRPNDSKVYGGTVSNRLYTLNEFSGVATFVGALSTAVVDPALSDGIDLNPERDFAGAASLRFVSSAGGNFAVNANTGAVGNAAGSMAPNFTAVAYSNSTPGAAVGPTSTQLYYIDSAADTLSTAPSAFNVPTIVPIGGLGIDVLRASGFELTGDNRGFAALNVDNGWLATGIYGFDLATGQASLLGNYSGTLTGLTVSAVPEPTTWAMLALGLAVVGAAERRSAAG